MRLLLVGNYGVENLGDEALKEYFLTRFPEIDWVVVSAHPKGEEVPRLPLGIRSLVASSWWKTVQALRRSDGLVFGGGSLFTDTESLRACVLWFLHAFAARFFRKPVYLAFQGIGPFRTRLGEALARWTARRAVFISVRDYASKERVERWRLNTKVVQTFDPVLTLISARNIERAQKVLIVIPRRNSDLAFEQRVAEILSNGHFQEVRMLSLEPLDPAERSLFTRLSARFHASVVPIAALDRLVSEVSAAEYVIAQRYHGALAAFALRVPFETVSQKKGDKLETLQSADLSSARRFLADGEHALRKALSGQTE